MIVLLGAIRIAGVMNISTGVLFTCLRDWFDVVRIAVAGGGGAI